MRYNVVSKSYRIVYEGYHGDAMPDENNDKNDNSSGDGSASKMSKSNRSREHEGKVDQVK